MDRERDRQAELDYTPDGCKDWCWARSEPGAPQDSMVAGVQTPEPIHTSFPMLSARSQIRSGPARTQNASWMVCQGHTWQLFLLQHNACP